MLDMVELARKSMMIENPMTEASRVQKRYAQYTPCRRCAGRVEDDPSPVADVCGKCATGPCALAPHAKRADRRGQTPKAPPGHGGIE